MKTSVAIWIYREDGLEIEKRKKKSGSTSPGLDASDALNGWAESLIWPDLPGSSRVLWTPLDASRGTAQGAHPTVTGLVAIMSH